MKIISIDLSKTWGIKNPETGEEFEWENDEQSPSLFSSSLITAVFPHEFPEDTTFTNDRNFTTKWIAFYEKNQIRIDEDGEEELVFAEDLIEEFDSPHFALELTTYGMACGPVSFSIYLILEEKYESKLDSLLIKTNSNSKKVVLRSLSS